LRSAVDASRRVLVGFDFAYGYPTGLSDLLNLTPADHAGTWRALWDVIGSLCDQPDIGGGDVQNRVNIEAVANQLNTRCMNHLGPGRTGPWWGRGDWTRTRRIKDQLPPAVTQAAPFAKGTEKGRRLERCAICREHRIEPTDFPNLQITSPGFPFGPLERLRRVERLAVGSQETWKIRGIGSVGGQILAGMPYLSKLYADPLLCHHSEVWPFTTGFNNPVTVQHGPLIVHA
jgi:hypothetical protein